VADRPDPGVVTISGIGTIPVEEFDRRLDQARRDRYRAHAQAYERVYLGILLRKASPRAAAAAVAPRADRVAAAPAVRLIAALPGVPPAATLT
jgi:hypothetical protein